MLYFNFKREFEARVKYGAWCMVHTILIYEKVKKFKKQSPIKMTFNYYSISSKCIQQVHLNQFIILTHFHYKHFLACTFGFQQNLEPFFKPLA